MSGEHREFRAKSVDQAIADACRFFAVDRDGLEIEIVSGGSQGFFGFGARQAVVRAGRRRPAVPLPAENRAGRPDSGGPRPEVAPMEEAPPQKASADAAVRIREEAGMSEADSPEEDDGRDAAPDSMPEDEVRRLEACVREILSALLRPLCAGARLDVDMTARPVAVRIEADDAEVLMSQDGQVIAALQYLANRIAARTCPGCPRIRLDAGDFRRDQETRLTEMALALAEKAKKTGKVQSTRPLSAFHRRIVHMTLQDDGAVHTRSKGEGSTKRVLILPVRRSSGRGRRKHSNEQ